MLGALQTHRPSSYRCSSAPVASRPPDSAAVVVPWASNETDVATDAVAPLRPSVEALPEASGSGNSLMRRVLGTAMLVAAVIPIGGAATVASTTALDVTSLGQVSPAPALGSLTSPSDSTAPWSAFPRGERVYPRVPTQKGDYVAHKVNFSALMSNEEFTDATALDVGQIQSVLERNHSFLATYQQDGRQAARIIADAAAAHRVNPRVILATLEKENSLVTREKVPPAWVLRSAMGYAYNDGGGTAGRSSTFASQVDKGTQLMRQLFDEGQALSYPHRMSVDYNQRRIQVDNAATHALMRYTPHTVDTHLPVVGGGNYNFHHLLKRLSVASD